MSFNQTNSSSTQGAVNIYNNSQFNNSNNQGLSNNISNERSNTEDDSNLDRLKSLTKILFIDDDKEFKVVSILKKAGWKNTKSIEDVDNLDSPQIKDTDIFFVDIRGVGLSMGFKDEGLGLSKALKEKYPNKKLIIYSSETHGERFHPAFRLADSLLPKNAEPYEFQVIVEQYSKITHG